MKNTAFKTLVICSLATSSVSASDRCEAIFAYNLPMSHNETNSFGLKFNVKKGAGVNDQSLARFQNALSNIKNTLIGDSTFLFAPATLELRVSTKPINPFYSHGEETFIQFSLRKSMELRSHLKKPPRITLPSLANKRERLKQLQDFANEQPIPDGELRIYSKHPKYDLVSVAHEFGHSIFHETMLKRSGLYRKRTNSFAEFSERIKKSKEKMASLETELEKVSDDKKAQAIEERLIKLEDQLLDYQEIFWNTYLNDPYGKIQSLIDGYNELFADLTAVLYFKDPKIMYKSLTNTKYLQYLKNETGHEPAISRDFTNRNNKIERWLETDEPHEIFAPVRYFIFETFLSRPLFVDREPRKLYEKVFNSILNEINFLVDNPEANLSPSELNQRLIRDIEKSTELGD